VEQSWTEAVTNERCAEKDVHFSVLQTFQRVHMLLLRDADPMLFEPRVLPVVVSVYGLHAGACHGGNREQVGQGVRAMTKRDQLLEARAAISEGMERVAVQRDIWQNELIWWLCKAVLLLIEKELKTK
jgi:hypothetical protein